MTPENYIIDENQSTKITLALDEILNKILAKQQSLIICLINDWLAYNNEPQFDGCVIDILPRLKKEAHPIYDVFYIDGIALVKFLRIDYNMIIEAIKSDANSLVIMKYCFTYKEDIKCSNIKNAVT